MTAKPTPSPATDDLLTQLSGTLSDEDRINERLRIARDRTILITPSTAGRLQPGCSAAFTLVWVDPRQCYKTGLIEVDGRKVDGWAPGRAPLMRLAAAAGVVWDDAHSGRVDDRRHPHIVHWHAVGAWLSLDGSPLPLLGDSQFDLRDGGDAARKVLESAKPDGKVTPDQQLRDKRAKILELAQTGAKLRAIRDLGITAYTLEELRTKPFCVVRAFFDGRDPDPEMERENKRAIRAKYLGGAAALFGAPEPRALGPARPHFAPPEIVDGVLEDDEPSVEGFAAWRATPPVERSAPPPTSSRAAASPPARPAAPPPPAPSAPQPPAPGGPPRSGFVMPGGPAKGAPIEDAPDENLNYWITRISRNLNNGFSKAPEQDQALLEAMEHEARRRADETANGAPY